MIKSWIAFNEELKTETYADIMNKTENYPWVKFLGDKLNKADKMQSVNVLAKELFTREFLKEFKPGITIKNGGETWKFEHLIFNANYTNYSLSFTNGREYLVVKNKRDGYYLDAKEDNLGETSKKLVIDMLKYMK